MRKATYRFRVRRAPQCHRQWTEGEKNRRKTHKKKLQVSKSKSLKAGLHVIAGGVGGGVSPPQQHRQAQAKPPPPPHLCRWGRILSRLPESGPQHGKHTSNRTTCDWGCKIKKKKKLFFTEVCKIIVPKVISDPLWLCQSKLKSREKFCHTTAGLKTIHKGQLRLCLLMLQRRISFCWLSYSPFSSAPSDGIL